MYNFKEQIDERLHTLAVLRQLDPRHVNGERDLNKVDRHNREQKEHEIAAFKDLYSNGVLALVGRDMYAFGKQQSVSSWNLLQLIVEGKQSVQGKTSTGASFISEQKMVFDGVLLEGTDPQQKDSSPKKQLFVGFGPTAYPLQVVAFGGEAGDRAWFVPRRNRIVESLVTDYFGDKATKTPGVFPINFPTGIDQMRSFMDELTPEYFEQAQVELTQGVAEFVATQLPTFFTS